MLSLDDNRMLDRCEDYYLAPPEDEYEDEEYWNRADDEAEEMWFQRLREGDL